MSEQKKQRKMTPKWFISQAAKQGARSAEGFIAAHREFLLTGSLAKVTAPVLAKLDAKQMYPTPCLTMLTDVILGHLIAQQNEEQEEIQAVVEEDAGAGRVVKPWTAIIYRADGTIWEVPDRDGMKKVRQNFHLSQQADRWVDLRLVESPVDCYGVVDSNTMHKEDGSAISTRTERLDAIARVFKKKGQPTMRKTSGGSSRLSFGIKNGKTTRVEFSRG